MRKHLCLSVLLFVLSALPVHAAGLKLTWTDASNNEDKFQVERSVNGPALSFVLIAEPAASATTYVDTTVLVNVEYAYRVRAVNAAGSSGYSNTAIGKLVPLPSVPATPGALSVTPLQ